MCMKHALCICTELGKLIREQLTLVCNTCARGASWSLWARMTRGFQGTTHSAARRARVTTHIKTGVIRNLYE